MVSLVFLAIFPMDSCNLLLWHNKVAKSVKINKQDDDDDDDDGDDDDDEDDAKHLFFYTFAVQEVISQL